MTMNKLENSHTNQKFWKELIFQALDTLLSQLLIFRKLLMIINTLVKLDLKGYWSRFHLAKKTIPKKHYGSM